MFEGKSVFAKIMGFDRFGNSPTYPSSAEFDGVTELVLDNTLPTATSLSFQITSSADTVSNRTLVDIAFSWMKSIDELSGLRDYTIEIFQMLNGTESMITSIGNIPAGDTTFTLEKFEIQDEFFEDPLFFRITPRDFADNRNADGDVTEFKFFSPPQLLSVVRDSITNNVTATWTKVPAADKYLFVFAKRKEFFLDPGLRNNPGNREIIPANAATDPDTITRVINRIFNPTDSTYFRMLATKADIFESGFGNFVFLPPARQILGSGSITTGVGDERAIPTAFALMQNYPNPFNPETRIAFEIPVQTNVEISIFNLAGKKIKTLTNREFEPGRYEAVWHGRDSSDRIVASGMYLYAISTSGFRQVKKCLFLK
jgi:hypothetical protein